MQLLDGKKLSQEILDGLKQTIETQKIKPGLVVVLVGEDPASQIYVKRKHKACEKVGIASEVMRLKAEISQDELLQILDELNARNDVHGILVQLPLPKHIDEETVLQRIDEHKDVDGFHLVNSGKLLRGQDALTPCTPTGVMEIMKAYDIPIEGKHAVVIGRSNIVGKPMVLLLLGQNATVTICHSRTQDIPAITREADIVVAAVGRPKMVKADWIKNGACLVDVGINRLGDGSLAGDIDFEDCQDKAGWMTPVPGGVGPLTIAMLLSNTVKAYQQQNR